MEGDIRVFDWVSIPRPLENPLLNRIFFGLHRGSSTLLGILVLGHIGAVVRHERRGTRVLRRMAWPGPKPQARSRPLDGYAPGPVR